MPPMGILKVIFTIILYIAQFLVQPQVFYSETPEQWTHWWQDSCPL